MKKTIFTGVGTAIVTPFTDDGAVNYDCFTRLLDFQLQNCADAIVVCGTTGESSTLTDEEHLKCIDYVVRHVNKTVPVIAGTGSNDTKYATWLSKAAERLGADAVLLVTPYYNKTTQEGLVQHFDTIVSGLTIPAILYNVPSRTGMSISVDAMKRLAKIPNIVAIKEASGDMSYVTKLFAECGELIDIYSGNDDLIVPIMALGGKGVISVLSNILPYVTHQITQFALKNMFFTATKLQLDYLRLINALFSEVNPIPIKEALNLMGYNVGKCRMPLTSMQPENQMLLKHIMWSVGLIND